MFVRIVNRSHSFVCELSPYCVSNRSYFFDLIYTAHAWVHAYFNGYNRSERQAKLNTIHCYLWSFIRALPLTIKNVHKSLQMLDQRLLLWALPLRESRISDTLLQHQSLFASTNTNNSSCVLDGCLHLNFLMTRWTATAPRLDSCLHTLAPAD